MTSLFFWHRSSWETCLHSQISHHLSPQNHTHAPLCQRAHSLHCCCAEDRPAVGTAAGFRALMQEQPHSRPVPKAAEAPRASPPRPARRQWGLSSQPSCMLKTTRQIVLNEEAGRGKTLILIRIGGHLLEYVLKPGKPVTPEQAVR